MFKTTLYVSSYMITTFIFNGHDGLYFSLLYTHITYIFHINLHYNDTISIVDLPFRRGCPDPVTETENKIELVKNSKNLKHKINN